MVIIWQIETWDEALIISGNYNIGILRIKIGEKDTQLPHSVDEVYYVVEGNGSIEIDGKIKPVKSTDFIFVPAKAHHKFIVGNKDLVVIYFFPS